MSRKLSITLMIAVGLIFVSCSATRHVRQGEYLLDKVSVVSEDGDEVSSTDLTGYIRQTPNHKVLGFWKLQLATYNLSGNDSNKWYNRLVRRIGQN
ncbi:MAG: outer membrane protein assembly factor, partial [Duncaniella sp.]|nr:outer membrane protein assembly factor [Duncaniella sp.]